MGLPILLDLNQTDPLGVDIMKRMKISKEATEGLLWLQQQDAARAIAARAGRKAEPIDTLVTDIPPVVTSVFDLAGLPPQHDRARNNLQLSSLPRRRQQIKHSGGAGSAIGVSDTFLSARRVAQAISRLAGGETLEVTCSRMFNTVQVERVVGRLFLPQQVSPQVLRGCRVVTLREVRKILENTIPLHVQEMPQYVADAYGSAAGLAVVPHPRTDPNWLKPNKCAVVILPPLLG